MGTFAHSVNEEIDGDRRIRMRGETAIAQTPRRKARILRRSVLVDLTNGDDEPALSRAFGCALTENP